jgi:hypothetical protein
MDRLTQIKRHLNASITSASSSLKGKKKEKSSSLMPFWVMKNKKCPEMTQKPGYTLKGKVAIITGGNRGIGYACAEQLAREGCHIVIGAKTVVSKEKTVETIYMARDQLLKEFGVRVLAVKCDVRSDIDLENLVNVTVQEFGQIDILVNNAAALVP